MPKKTAAKIDPNNNPDPVMDVSHPENAQADATSRPIIITRKPIVQDPMVRAEQERTEVPGPPALSTKTSKLRTFLTPKKSAGDEAASDLEAPVNQDSESELTVEQKIADAKVKVEEADASTIEEEKPEELKVIDNSGDKTETVEVVKSAEKSLKEKEVPASGASSGLPAAVKEMIEPEDVHISAEPTNTELAPKEAVKPVTKPAGNKKTLAVTDNSSTTKSSDKTGDELKDINDAPSEESTKALEAAIQEDNSKDLEKPAKESEAAEPTNTETSEDIPEAEAASEEDPNKEQKSGGLVDELAKQAADKKSKAKEEKELSAKEQKINKLIEDKTYFLPIGEVTRKRKNRKSLVVFLILLIVLAGAYAAMDAGLIEAPIELPIDIIQSEAKIKN